MIVEQDSHPRGRRTYLTEFDRSHGTSGFLRLGGKRFASKPDYLRSDRLEQRTVKFKRRGLAEDCHRKDDSANSSMLHDRALDALQRTADDAASLTDVQGWIKVKRCAAFDRAANLLKFPVEPRLVVNVNNLGDSIGLQCAFPVEQRTLHEEVSREERHIECHCAFRVSMPHDDEWQVGQDSVLVE